MPRHDGPSPRERIITTVTLLLRWLFRLLTPRPSLSRLSTGAARVLVLKPCCLGDVLMTTPALAAVRAAVPHCRVTYGVSRYALPAIASSPLVDGLLDMEAVGTGPVRSWTYLSSYLRLWAAIRAARFDACLVLDRSPLLALLPWLAGIPIRAGIDSAGRGFALNLSVPWSETIHECDLYLGVAGALDVPTGGFGLSFTPSPAGAAAAAQVWAAISKASGPVVALAAGGGVNPGMALQAKRWPAPRYASLALRLVQRLDATVLLVGGPTDATVNRAVADEAERAGAAVHDLTGRLDFGGLGALLGRCALFVGNDSAPMHLAAAVGCPVVALFGPTNPAMYAPYAEKATVVQAEMVGDAHGDGGLSAFTGSSLADLDLEPVWQACVRMLEREAAHAG